MNERTVFLNALEKEDSAQRNVYLDEACAGDAVLRERIEALLGAHDREGEFLDVPAAQQLAAVASGETQAEAACGIDDAEALDFLAPSDKPGSLGRLGHYEVLEVIGRGGMGVVLRAFDDQLHRIVAIKVMAAQLATNGTARKRFTREAQAAAAVSHDHIVTIFAVEDASGYPYLVMQYVAGMSLQERLDRNGPLQLTEILRIGMQTASGLAAAHAQGLVHRDIKPANILLENGVERVKVTDFGLARAAAEAHLTQSGVVAGTPQYMSPEQAEGKAIDQRTDLFSLGSVLYAMCTGRAPFRASGTMAVLKRVCEETPRPIRETNPDIPDWLVAVIDKLHAKDPAGRYQTAAEVAELLNQHLAHLQHPSIVPLPVTRLARPPTARRRRMMAALALLSLIAVVIVLAATLPRLFTPEETPIVKDSPEGKAPSSGTAAKADPHPFIVLDGKGVAERKFATLAEAVQSASAGDTIEVRGNGPFITTPIKTHQALTIRAGAGFRPVIKAGPDEQGSFLLQSYSLLVLEGLDLQWVDAKPVDPSKPVLECRLVVSNGPKAQLHAVNCRFLMYFHEERFPIHCIGVWDTPLCRLRNCHLLVAGQDKINPCFDFKGCPNATLIVDNCLSIGNAIMPKLTHAEPTKVVLNHNTLLGHNFVLLLLGNKIDPPGVEKDSRPFQIVSSANILAGRMRFIQLAASLETETFLRAADAERLLTQLVGWQENRNLYSSPDDSDLLGLFTQTNPGQQTAFPPTVPITTLLAWKNFWGMKELDSQRGQAKFDGGDLIAKAQSTPELIRPEDFRLRPDSPGYKAGKNGKDLGADVDLVGPGPAYERWKKTPDYQQWLKDTNQLTKTKTPTAEPKAFVLLGGKGIEVRKYGSLADAVQGASDGDTIEIRGNGPFVTEPIKITLPLTIRAGEGFRPVIKLSPEGLRKGAPLLESAAALVLEGLELQRMAQDRTDGPPLAVLTTSKDLHVANCRFLLRKTSVCISNSSPVTELRNCEFLNHITAGAMVSLHLQQTGKRLVIDNCLITAFARVNTQQQYTAKGTVVQLTRNTFRTKFGAFRFHQVRDNAPSPKDLDQRAKVLSIETSGNIFDASFVFQFEQYSPDKGLPAREMASHLAHTVGWVGERNLYAVDGPFGFFNLDTTGEPTTPVKNLVDWRRFWATAEANSIEGRVRYQGGDPLAKLDAAPEQLTPDDFRLLPDSAGYRAGKDGKDLGADIDFVGPGPPYERWRKTPAYQQWLKDSGQVKK